MIKRAPQYLRGVVSPSGKLDVLDQLEDVPAPREKVYVYERVGGWSSYHVRMTGRGSGFYVVAEYGYREDVDGEQLRDTEAWQAWCVAEWDAHLEITPELQS